MNKNQITTLTKQNQKDLGDFLNVKNPDFWTTHPEGKWTAGQHVIHLVQSNKPLLRALKLPSFVLKWRFGDCNRDPRSYDAVVQRYKEKLSSVGQGVLSPFSAKMPDSPASDAQKWRKELEKLTDQINSTTTKLNDKNMDQLLLPHPLMGKMTLREILMWNAYHTEHHLQILKEKY